MRTRRELLRQAALAGAAGPLGPAADAVSADRPPETGREGEQS